MPWKWDCRAGSREDRAREMVYKSPDPVGTSPRSPGESVIATDVTVMLTDEEPPTDKAFYNVSVGK